MSRVVPEHVHESTVRQELIAIRHHLKRIDKAVLANTRFRWMFHGLLYVIGALVGWMAHMLFGG